MEPLLSECMYHIYNHSNGNELLFKEEKNYFYFLERYRKYILPVAETYAYCLMPNHFHVLIQIKTVDEMVPLFNGKPLLDKYNKLATPKERDAFVSRFVSKQFSNLFSSYTQAFNRMYNRKGSLFIKNFKRKKVEDENYAIRLVNYIHLNPVKHGFVDKPEDWKFSSYNAIISAKPTWVDSNKVLGWFGDLGNFKYCHLEAMEI